MVGERDVVLVGIVWIFIIFIGFSLFIDKFLRKWFGVDKKKIADTSGKKVDRWGRAIIASIYLCTFPFITEDPYVMKLFLMSFLIVLTGFQLFLEWKYLKNVKEHVITIVQLLLALVIMYNVDYFI